MGSSEFDSVFVFADRDISVVQGSTEMYYLTKFFGEACETRVFAPTSRTIPNVETTSFPFDGLVGTFLLNVLFVPYWIMLFWRHRPDIVYCYQNVISPPLIASIICESITVHDIRSDPVEQAREFALLSDGVDPKIALYSLNKWLHRRVLPTSDLVVTLSEELADVLVNDYGVRCQNIHLLPLGVDIEKYKVTNSSSKKLSLVYIGTVHKRRGINDFVAGLLEMPKRKQQEVEFDIYGSGDDEYIRELKDTCRNDGEFEFQWHGRVPHDAVPGALTSADVGISPLPNIDAYRVSSPAKIVEYLAAGLPILATDITAHRRILSDDCAFLVDHDSDSYRDAVEGILSNRNQLSKMSTAAREKGERKDWEQQFSSLMIRLAEIKNRSKAS